MARTAAMPADKVAREIVHAIQRRKHKTIIGFRNRLWLLLNRLSPYFVDRVLQRYG